MKRWIISIIIVILLIWFVSAASTGKFNVGEKLDDLKEKIASGVDDTKKDSLISECMDSIKECKYIANRKYDVSFKILETHKFNDEEKAIEFFDIWKGGTQFYLEWELRSKGYGTTIEESLPLVMSFTKIKVDGGEIPTILICDNEGEMLGSSKARLLCN